MRCVHHGQQICAEEVAGFASVTDEIQAIKADKRRLKQMIVNLLSNAVKFTPQFGSMGLEILPENDNAIRFTVSGYRY
ncbi:MAG: hypothetical protein IPO22_23965 [Anaerolineales bacterium]|nr:hypothetical protein [Anaerolineales bacterium]